MNYHHLFAVSIKYTDDDGPRQIKFKTDDPDRFVEELEKAARDLCSHHNRLVELYQARQKAMAESGEDYYGPRT